MSSTDTVTHLVAACRSAARDAVTLVRAAAFWTAILLPMAALWLVATESPLLADTATVVKLTVLNVACLVAGHGYGSTPHYHE